MPSVDSGLVVRAWLDTAQLRGRLLMPMRATDDSVLYCRFPGVPCDERGVRGDMSWLRLHEIRHLDVQVGTRWKKGAWIGGLSGTLVTFLISGFANSFCQARDCPTDTEVFVISAISGGGFFGALGALIGSAFPRFERRF